MLTNQNSELEPNLEDEQEDDISQKVIKTENLEETVKFNNIVVDDNQKEQTNSKTNNRKKQEKAQENEEKVIEKIKNFISKIIAMQEEAAKEEKKEKNEQKENENKENDKNNKTNYMLEYYDLPYRYNETIVKILAQTPKKLFVYWDISDNDREKYKKTFGDDFFDKTYPVLLLYNEDMKYVKEIPINDFANSWYIDIQDPKTKYTIQLGRKFKQYPLSIDMEKVSENNIILKTDYLPFANSNILEAPNDHILLEYLPRFITFRNVKTNQEYVKDLRSLKNIFGRNYNVRDFYETHYKDEVSEGVFDMANPSSKLSSSTFK